MKHGIGVQRLVSFTPVPIYYATSGVGSVCRKRKIVHLVRLISCLRIEFRPESLSIQKLIVSFFSFFLHFDTQQDIQKLTSDCFIFLEFAVAMREAQKVEAAEEKAAVEHQNVVEVPSHVH